MKYAAVIFDFEGTITQGDVVYGDARDLIIKLHETGMLCGIASNASTHSIIQRLEKHNMIHYFDTIVGIDQVGFVGKPAPDIFIQAAENLNCAPENCIVIEDSLIGAEAAHRASMDVIMVRGERVEYAVFSCATLDVTELYNILF